MRYLILLVFSTLLLSGCQTISKHIAEAKKDLCTDAQEDTFAVSVMAFKLTPQKMQEVLDECPMFADAKVETGAGYVTLLMWLPYRELPIALEYATILMSRVADLDVRDDDDQTALHHAVMARNPRFVQLYARSMMNKNVPDDKGRTPLDLAAGLTEKGMSPADRLGDNDPGDMETWAIIRTLVHNGARHGVGGGEKKINLIL